MMQLPCVKSCAQDTSSGGLSMRGMLLVATVVGAVVYGGTFAEAANLGAREMQAQRQGQRQGGAMTAQRARRECWQQFGVSLVRRAMHIEAVFSLKSRHVSPRRCGDRAIDGQRPLNFGVVHIRTFPPILKSRRPKFNPRRRARGLRLMGSDQNPAVGGSAAPRSLRRHRYRGNPERYRTSRHC